MKLGRRALLSAVAVTALLGSASTVATASASSAPHSPAAKFATEASQFQNSAIARAMAQVPGGTRVSADEVQWGHGAVILKVPVSPDASAADLCAAAYVCTWNAPNFTGTGVACLDVNNKGGWCNFGAYINAEESVQNRTAYRYWMHSQQNNTGTEYCINPWTDPTNIPSSNDHDYWGLITVNPNNC